MLQDLPEVLRIGLARLLLVVGAFGIIWLLRSFVAWLISKPIKLLLDRAGQNGVDGTIRTIVIAPTNYLLLALALDIGARILEVNTSVMSLIIHLSRTLVIVAIALAIYRLAQIVVFSRRRLFILTGLAVDEALLPFIRTGIQLIALALGLVIIIQEWGYDVTGLIAGLGLGGLALSLAAQDTLSNLFGFAAIISDRPFVVGEYVKTKDVEGLIERVGLRSTRVRQLDQAIVAVPNSMLAASSILNWSRLARRRIDLTLGVTYKTQPDQMEMLLSHLRTMLADRETVEPNSVVVYFIDFGQSALNILVRCYVNISDWGEFTAEKERILLEIMRVVENLGLQIAFPSQSLYIESRGDGPNLSEQALETSSTQQNANPLSMRND